MVRIGAVALMWYLFFDGGGRNGVGKALATAAFTAKPEPSEADVPDRHRLGALNARAGEAGLSLQNPNWIAALRVYLVTIALGNFVWEGAHLPLYTIWTTGTMREKTLAIVHCTGGDLLIALSSLVIAIVVVGERTWPIRSFWPVTALSLSIGLTYTAFSEWFNIVIRQAWEYSNLMPVVSVFRLQVGLSPLVQWIAVPSAAFWLARRRVEFDRPTERARRQD